MVAYILVAVDACSGSNVISVPADVIDAVDPVVSVLLRAVVVLGGSTVVPIVVF